MAKYRITLTTNGSGVYGLLRVRVTKGERIVTRVQSRSWVRARVILQKYLPKGWRFAGGRGRTGFSEHRYTA